MVKPIPQDVLRAIAEDDLDIDEKLKLMSDVQDVVDRDYTDGIPFKAVIELAKAYVAHYEGDHRRAWKIAKPLTSDEYLSRTRQDHFAQLEKALNQAKPNGGSSRLARLIKKVKRRA